MNEPKMYTWKYLSNERRASKQSARQAWSRERTQYGGV
jgi:hypothetical protein